jgi:hypothetical protein
VTDRERFEALMADFGVPLNPTITHVWEPDPDRPNDLTIIADAPGDRVEGYIGFRADFTFDDDGNFVKVGIWE